MDNDWAGSGNMYDYGFRIYDPRVGRFLSLDPLRHSFPGSTPYSYAANAPILLEDHDGKGPKLPKRLSILLTAVIHSAHVFMAVWRSNNTSWGEFENWAYREGGEDGSRYNKLIGAVGEGLVGSEMMKSFYVTGNRKINGQTYSVGDPTVAIQDRTMINYNAKNVDITISWNLTQGASTDLQFSRIDGSVFNHHLEGVEGRGLSVNLLVEVKAWSSKSDIRLMSKTFIRELKKFSDKITAAQGSADRVYGIFTIDADAYKAMWSDSNPDYSKVVDALGKYTQIGQLRLIKDLNKDARSTLHGLYKAVKEDASQPPTTAPDPEHN